MKAPAAVQREPVSTEQRLANTMDELQATALRVKHERDEAIKLLRRTLELREIGHDGCHKTDICTYLALINEPVQGPSIARFDRLRAIESAVARLNPEPRECVEILHAIQASLRYQFDDRSNDAQDGLSGACEALEELERTEQV